MESVQQPTSSTQVSLNETLDFDGVKYKVESVLGSGLTSKVYKATNQLIPVIHDA